MWAVPAVREWLGEQKKRSPGEAGERDMRVKA